MAIVAPRRRVGSVTLRNTLTGLAFCAPWIIGLLAFRAYPIAAAFWYSLTDYQGMNPPEFIGLANYGALTRDSELLNATRNTVEYTVMAIPAAIVTAFTLALVLNSRTKGLALYRTLFFLPILVPDAALAIVWLQMFNPQWGLANALIEGVAGLFGLQIAGPGWVASTEWSKPTLVLLNIWVVGQAMVIYLAALQDVPQDLLDAASVDGANWFQKIRNVTLPLVTPVIFFQLVTGLIGSLQLFTQPFIISRGVGEPAQSLMFYSMQLFRQAFVYFNMGRATAMAWVLFLVILLLSFVIFRTSGWVHYGGEEKK
ncbi:MAG TPA: sugar ABC transporter permease [Chloroflexota bacterium]|jgi:multiple sugar transport system permease protein